MIFIKSGEKDYWYSELLLVKGGMFIDETPTFKNFKKAAFKLIIFCAAKEDNLKMWFIVQAVN